MEYVGNTERAFVRQVCGTSPSDELVQTSEGHYTRLIKVANSMNGGSYSKEYLMKECQVLQDFSYRKMRTGAPAVGWVWRILYVDSCILRSIFLLNALDARQSIGQLDKAIIVAGGGDESRLDLILSLISKIQQKFLSPPTQSQKFLNEKLHCSPDPLLTACNQVPSIDSEMSFFSFQSIHSKGPFVVRGYAHDWPALTDKPWNSIDYFLSVSGLSRLVPVEVGHDYRDEHWSQVLMDWESFLYSLDDAGGVSKASQDALYLAQYDLLRQFPTLRGDIVIPDYVYCSLTPQDFPDYHPPENVDGAILNVWLGPQGAMSPGHFDPYHNFYIQVVGYKTVWLSPPQTSLYMEGRSLLLERPNESPASGASTDILESTVSSNTSRLDVFSYESIDGKSNAFIDKVIPQAMSVMLGPGDLLFFPPGWWHGMRSESTSLSISMWF